MKRIAGVLMAAAVLMGTAATADAKGCIKGAIVGGRWPGIMPAIMALPARLPAVPSAVMRANKHDRQRQEMQQQDTATHAGETK